MDIKDAGKKYDNAEAQAMISAFKAQHPNVNNGGATYGINKIQDIIDQGVDGLNIYFGRDGQEDTIVVYGADSNGNNIDGAGAVILEAGIKLP